MAKKPKIKRVVIDANGNVSDYKGSNMEQRINTAAQQRQTQQREAQQRRELAMSPAKVANNRRLNDIRTVDTVNNFDDVTKKRNQEAAKNPRKGPDALVVAGKTGLNLATNLLHGAGKKVEGLVDSWNNAGDTINNYLTHKGNEIVYGKKRADEVLKEDKKDQEKFIKRNLLKEAEDKIGYTKNKEKLEKDSLITSDNEAGQFVQSLGGVAFDAALARWLGGGGLPTQSLKGLKGLNLAKALTKNAGIEAINNLPGYASLGSSAYGNSLEQALNEGYSMPKSQKYALSSLPNEVIPELAFGGIPGTRGIGALDDIGERGLSKVLKGAPLELGKSAVRNVGEGLEEKATTYLDALSRQNILGEKQDWNEVEKQSNKDFWGGVAMGTILNAPRTVSDVRQAHTESKKQAEIKRQEVEKQKQKELRKQQREEQKRLKMENEAKLQQQEVQKTAQQNQPQEQQNQAVEPQIAQPRPVANQTQKQAQNEVINTKKQEVQNQPQEQQSQSSAETTEARGYNPNPEVGKLKEVNLDIGNNDDPRIIVGRQAQTAKGTTLENYKNMVNNYLTEEGKQIVERYGGAEKLWNDVQNSTPLEIANKFDIEQNRGAKLTNEVQTQNNERIYNGRNYSSDSYSKLSDNDIKSLDAIYTKQKNKEALTKSDRKQLDYFKRKSKGLKHPELTTNNTFEETRKDLSKTNLNKYDDSLMKQAKNIVEANKQGRRTKQQWLDTAKYMGMQMQDADSQSIKEYALQTFKSERPNVKDNLNRQGSKFVDFKVNEWVNAFYEGAGVGKQANTQQTDTQKAPQPQQEERQIENKRVELSANKESADQVLKIDEKGNATMLDGKPEILDKVPKEHTPAWEKAKNTWNKFRHHITDHRAAIYDLSREYKNPTLYHEADALDAVNGKAQVDIGKNQIDSNGRPFKNFIDEKGKKVSMSFEKAYDIYKDIPNQAKNEFLVNNLNIDRLRQGVEQFEGMDEAYSESRLEELREKYPDIDKWAENIYQYNRNLQQKMVDSGRISAKTAENWQKLTPHYVRIQRDVSGLKKSGVSTRNGRVSSENLIKTVKGGSLPILPIKETTAQYTVDVMEALQYNKFGKELAGTIGLASSNGNANDNIDIDEMFGADAKILDKDGKGNYSITIYDKGAPISVPINEAIYESLQKRDLRRAPVLSQMTKVQRNLLTNLNPYFAFATNPVKDFQDMFLYSKFSAARNIKTYTQLFGGRTFGKAKNAILGTPDGVSTKDWVDLYYNQGNAANSYYNNGEFKKKSGPVGKVVKFIPNAVEAGGNFLESMPRITEFVNTIQKEGYTINKSDEGSILIPRKGKTPKKSVEQVLSEANYNAADVTTNFKRGGTWAKNIDRNGGTFFSASVQGASRFARTFTEAFGDAKNGDFSAAMRLFARAAAFGVAPSLLARAMYGGDDDEEYEEIQDYQKDRYYLFKREDGTIVRVPKGRALSLFQSFARRSVDASKGKKGAFKGFGQLVENQIAPNDPLESNILAPWTAVKRNESWSGNKIVSDFLSENYNPEDQYDAKTTEFSKWAGKKLKNVPLENMPFFGAYLETIKSPKKLDYLLDQYSGVIGDIALPSMTNYAESENSSGFSVLANPLKSKFTADPVLSSKLVNDYYTLKSKTIKDSNGENASNLQKAKNQYIAGKYSDVPTHISSLYAEQREIQNSKTLSDSEKYKQNKAKQKEINDYMKEVMNNVKNAKEVDGIVKIGNKSYVPGKTTYGADTMKEISTKKVEASKSIGLSIGEYSKVDSHISGLEADKDSNGKSISGTKKKKAISYLRDSGYSNDKIKAIVEAYGWKYKEGD